MFTVPEPCHLHPRTAPLRQRHLRHRSHSAGDETQARRGSEAPSRDQVVTRQAVPSGSTSGARQECAELGVSGSVPLGPPQNSEREQGFRPHRLLRGCPPGAHVCPRGSGCPGRNAAVPALVGTCFTDQISPRNSLRFPRLKTYNFATALVISHVCDGPSHRDARGAEARVPSAAPRRRRRQHGASPRAGSPSCPCSAVPPPWL